MTRSNPNNKSSRLPPVPRLPEGEDGTEKEKDVPIVWK